MLDFYAKEDFSRTVYTIDFDTFEIESHVLQHLCEEWADEVNGRNRFFVRDNTLCYYEGWAGATREAFSFDNEDEAYHALLLTSRHALFSKDDAPQVFYSLDDAKEEVKRLKEDGDYE